MRFAREPGTANVQSLGDMSWDYRANGKWQIMERSPGNGGIGLNIHFWGKANDNRIKGHAIGRNPGHQVQVPWQAVQQLPAGTREPWQPMESSSVAELQPCCAPPTGGASVTLPFGRG